MWGEMRWSQPNQVRPGFSPQMSYWMEKIESEIERDKRSNSFCSGIGFTKFVEQIKQCCQLGSERKIQAPCCYLYPKDDPKAVAQIEKVSWYGNQQSNASLLYLTKLYVLDTERDSGIGTKFLKEIKRIVDDTGMVLFLHAESFSLSNKEGGLPFAFYDMDELLKYWDSEKLTYTDGDVLLIEWYKRLGFINACTHDEGNWPAKDYHRLDKQFLHVGKNNPQRDLYLKRTKVDGMCETCRLQVLGEG